MSSSGSVDLPTADGRAARCTRESWSRALPSLALTIAFIVALYWDTAVAMAGIWARSDTFAHGFVVPFVVAWLIWRKRSELATLSPRPCWGALPLLAIAGFAWFVGELAQANAVAQLAFVLSLILAVPAVLGMQVARSIGFPLAFLLFAVPVGEFVMPQLMEWTADFVVLGLRLSGIPVYREGLQFVIPSGNWSVIEACSGVRYLIASVSVGTLYAYLTYRSLRRRLLFVLAAFLVPIVANWVRAYLIVMLGHLSGNRLAVGVDHLIYGWLFFGLVIVLMFWIGTHWREDGQPEPRIVTAPTPAAESPGNRVWLGALVAAMAASVGFSARALTAYPDHAMAPELNLPARLGEWTALPGGGIDWKPRFEKPNAEVRSTFARGADRVGVYIGFYRNQDYERKMISSSNVLVTSNDPQWNRLAGGRRELVIDGKALEIRTADLRGPEGSRWLAWQWYWIDGRLTASDTRAKLLTVLARLRGRGDDCAVVVLIAAQDQAMGADVALAAFAAAAAPKFDGLLRQAEAQP
jgi:exosortase A